MSDELYAQTYTLEEVMASTLEYFNGDELATSTAVTKYLLTKPTENGYNYVELTPSDMHDRLAKEFYRIEQNYPNPLPYNIIRESIDKFKYIVPQGSVMFGAGNPYSVVSLSNCMVLPEPKDSMSGIFDTAKDLANLSKRRAGVGICLDSLRPEGSLVSNSAKYSSGAWSFADFMSNTGRVVGQGGRRAAIMIGMSISHPDIEKFITMKQNLDKVTSANVSVLIGDEFMNAVETDKDFVLRWPVESSPSEALVTKTISAKYLWNLINDCANKTGEPGIIFIENYKKNLPADYYPNFKSIVTNPCVTADTLVAVADGRGAVKIGELAECGADVPVYCYDNEMNIHVRQMRHPRKTGDKVQVYNVLLDDGNSIRCTHNHKFLNTNGEYVETKDLKSGDSLKIMSRFVQQNKHNGIDYWNICGGHNFKVRSEHRYISEFFAGQNILADQCVQHSDFNTLNNHPDNLKIMLNVDHNNLHRFNKLGSNNPMFKNMNGGWSEARKQEYINLLSERNSGELNSQYCGFTHEEIKQNALSLTKKLNRRFTNKEWQEYASENKLPQNFSQWRKNSVGSINILSKWAALNCGIEYIDIDNRILTTYNGLLSNGYNAFIENNNIYLNVTCEVCAKQFTVPYQYREVCVCSSKCSARKATFSVNRLTAISKRSKEIRNTTKNNQLQVYSDLKFQRGQEPTCKDWESACKINNVPYRLNYVFKNYSELKQYANQYNHKVISVSEDGFEDVYCGTVDEFHNYFVGGFETKTSANKPRFVFVNNSNCGEVLLSSHDSCRLLSENLKNFVKNPFMDNAYFDYDLWREQTRIAMRLIDDIVDLEIEALGRIIDKVDDPDEKTLWTKIKQAAISGRRTGLGCHGLADALACLKISYNSQEAIDVVDKIYSTLRDVAYQESVNMAIERGAFSEFNWEYEKNCPFIQRLPIEIQEQIKKHGRRNISLLTQAPTGSVSIMSQTSSGVEPVFSYYYNRNKKVNFGDENEKEDSVDLVGDRWAQYAVFHHNVSEYMDLYPEVKTKWKDIEKNTKPSEWSSELSQILPSYFVSANTIDPLKKIELIGKIQEYIDHGCSQTVNAPKGTTVIQVQDMYMNAWKYGLKGVTVYVDGSRSGVLVQATDKKDENIIRESFAPRRPKELPCDIHRSQIDGQDWTILVGILNDKPYEIFGGLSEHIVLPRRRKNGIIVKRKCEPTKPLSCYDLIIGDDAEDEEDDNLVIKDMAMSFKNESYATHTRMLSMSLRHGIPIQFIVEQIGKDQSAGFHSFFKVIARVLKKYIKDGTKGTDKCATCGEKLIFVEGCSQCPGCGMSKCG